LIAKKSERITFKTHTDKSEAWKWFVKILVDNKACDFVKCTGCSSVLKYIYGHGTGSMLGHLKGCKAKTAKQATLLTTPGFLHTIPSKRSLSAADKSDLTDCMTMMCAKDIR
jgi:hypothetical protein